MVRSVNRKEWGGGDPPTREGQLARLANILGKARKRAPTLYKARGVFPGSGHSESDNRPEIRRFQDTREAGRCLALAPLDGTAKSIQVFQQEWNAYDYADPAALTFGCTKEQRRSAFLKVFPRDKIAGSRMLDAGCGSGIVTQIIYEEGGTPIGLDIVDLSRANKHFPRVQFVKGSVLHLPFKPATFDHAYCSGVLHHTRSTREAFTQLAALVKKGGTLYVWVYCKSRWPLRRRIQQTAMRALVKPLPVAAQRWLLLHILMPAFGFKAAVKGTARTPEWRNRRIMEFFDGLAVPYDHKQTPREVAAWFQEAGYTFSFMAEVIPHSGFGIGGVRR